MIVRELLTRIGYTVDRKSEQTARGAFERLKGAATSLGTILVTGVVAQGFKRMIDAASDAEETMNVVTTAFEDQTDRVLEWAKESGEAAGRSEFAMREYAATLGAVVGPTLGSAEATADLSTNMAQLAVDLGSFFNASDEDALAALRSGLIGQAEPMLRFGVSMNVAALDAFALAQGLGKTTKQMTEAEKITLRYRFILDRTAKAQGDAEKTSDSYANLVKRLDGRLLDLQIGLGKQLLPAMADFVKVLNEIAKVSLGPVKFALRSLGNAFKFVSALVIGLWQAFMDLGAAGKTILSTLLFFTLAFFAPWLLFPLLIGLAVAGLIVILEDLWKALTSGEGVFAGLLGEFTHWFIESDSILTAFGQILKNAVNFWGELLTGSQDTWGDFGAWLESLWQGWGDAVGGFGDAVGEAFSDVTVWIKSINRAVADFLAGGIGKVISLIPEIGAKLVDLDRTFGLVDDPGASIAVPGSPAAARGDITSNQQIDINVNAPGGDGPAIGAAVGAAVGKATRDGNRQLAQQALAGGVTS